MLHPNPVRPSRRRIPLLLIAIALSAACDDDPAEHSLDIGSDSQAEVEGDLDGEVVEDPGDELDTAPDLDLGDAVDLDPGETGADTIEEPPPLPPCPDPPVGPAPPAGRWSLSLFHFNIQYVAGGTEDFAVISANLPSLAEELDLSEEEVEDRIIEESLVPLLGILERNPGLALTFEMQGLMVDVIAERHPETLARMQDLVGAGQLELASIHWSDQLFLAFGREDMDESWRRTEASFAAADLPLSRVVFTQEGQFGEGFAEWLAETRPDAVAVLARNLQGFYRSGEPDEPLWLMNGLRVIAPRGLTNAIVDRQWSFFDDGELLATGDLNPYAGRLFAENPAAVRAYEHELQCAHQNGYRVGRIADYVEAVEAELETLPEHGPILDGTWQPNSTRGPLRWLGGAGDVFARHEQDRAVLVTCHLARHRVLALQAVVDELGEAAPGTAVDALDDAWRELLLGEVSDARGVNPWWGEVQYGLMHCGAARDAADAVLEAERGRREIDALVVDTASGAVLEEVLPVEPAWAPAVAPIEVTLLETGDRVAELVWERDGTDGPYRLTVLWPALEAEVNDYEDCLAEDGEVWSCRRTPRPLAISVPRVAGAIGYRPALADEPVAYSEADFALGERAFTDAAWSVAADGFIDLGESRYLVKEVTTVPLAVGWPAGEGRNGVIWVRDETLPRFEDASWVFYYTTDRDQALALAERNLRPVVVVADPD